MYRSLVALTAVTLVASTAFAQSSEESRSRPDRRPPPEAQEACTNLVQGDPCSFEGMHDDTVQGTCDLPKDQPLACRPEGGPPKDQPERK